MESIVTADEWQHRVRDHVDRFQTSVIGLSSHDELEYIGSGTLVVIKGVPGVLTADHVWQELLDRKHPQVVFPGTRTFTAPSHLLRALTRIHRTPPRTTDTGFEPDLAFIELPDDYAVKLGECGKRFYDLTSSRRGAESIPATAVGDRRLILGIPEETTSWWDDEDSLGPIKRMRVDTHALASRIVDVSEHDGYDFAEFSLEDKMSDDFPERMFGMSGSALWWVGRTAPSGGIQTKLDEITLDGVLVRHAPEPPEVLRCHGRKSIYRFHDSVTPLSRARADGAIQ